MDFAQPSLLWLFVIAPLAGAAAAWAWRRRLQSTAAWAAAGLWDRLFPGYRASLLVASATLFALVVLGAGLALAQPRWGASEVEVERRGVDVVFVLDTSLSMAARDVQPDRLWVAQTLIRRLVLELPGHRVALVQAEGEGVAMVPLTSDGAVINLLLDAVAPGSLPTPGTDLAPALDRALELFPEEGSKHRVLILLSDGEDHGSGLERAAAALHAAGVVAHAIGVGTREGQPLELPGSARRGSAGGGGGRVEYKRDEAGNVVVSRLVEETLEELSRQTGGLYLRAATAAVELEPLLARIDEMETRSYGSEWINTLEERFQWPAGLAIAALFLHLAIAPFRHAEAP